MDRTSRSLNCSCRHQGSSERPVASGRGSQKTQTPIARSRDAGRAPRRVWRSGRYSVRRVHAVGASEEDEANLLGHDRGAPPVVQVVLQVPISDAELELLRRGGGGSPAAEGEDEGPPPPGSRGAAVCEAPRAGGRGGERGGERCVSGARVGGLALSRLSLSRMSSALKTSNSCRFARTSACGTSRAA